MKKAKIVIILILSSVLGLFMGYRMNQIQVNAPIDYCYSVQGNLYLLTQQKQGTHLLQFDQSGTLQSDTVLQAQSGEEQITYKAIALDEKNNVYLLTENSTVVTTGTNEAKRMVTAEAVRMYDANLRPIRLAINLEQQGASEESHLKKLFVCGQMIYAGYQKGSQVEFYAVNAITNGASQKLTTFQTVQPQNQEDTQGWMLDFICTPEGRALYSTADGKVYRVTEGKSEDVTQMIGGKGIASDFFLNQNGAICFVEQLSQTLYCADLESGTAEKLFTINSRINEAEKLDFNAAKQVKMDLNGVYHAVVQSNGASEWVDFGNEQHIISRLQGNLFPRLLIRWAICTAGLAVILLLLYAFICRLQGRVLLAHRMTLLFWPICVCTAIGLTIGLAAFSMVPVYEELEKSMQLEAEILIEQLNRLPLGQVDLLRDYGTDSYAVLAQTFADATNEAVHSGGRADGVRLYTTYNQRLFVGLSADISQRFQSLDAFADANEQTLYQTVLASPPSTEDGQPICTLNRQNEDQWRLLMPMTLGEKVGVLEISVDRIQYVHAVFYRNLAVIGSCVGVASLILFCAFLLVLHRCLRPLGELKQTADRIAEGKWAERVQLLAKDELGDIGSAFNMMTDKLNQYISNLVVLNRAYIKFVPRELFHMLGKTKITEIALRDQNMSVMSILYVGFRMGHTAENAVSETAYFDMLNDSFDKLFEIIRKNDGVIDQFDGVGMLCLFPASPEGAVTASIQFREFFEAQGQNSGIKEVVSTGNTLIGVAGNETRNTMIAVSNEITRSYQLSNRMEEMGLQHIMTQDTIAALRGKEKGLQYRFAGHIASETTPLKIYEILDGLPYYQKKLYLTTQGSFEQGVAAYIAGDFRKARDCFAEVICVNENDRAAMYYLMLCEENSRKNHKVWTGNLM